MFNNRARSGPWEPHSLRPRHSCSKKNLTQDETLGETYQTGLDLNFGLSIDEIFFIDADRRAIFLKGKVQ